MNARSLLFVPGDRPERFGKALASAAQLVCIDLEDAVAPQRKGVARQNALDFLPHAPVARLALRINSIRTPAGLGDLLALSEAALLPCFVVIPKVEAAAEVAVAAGTLPRLVGGLIPIVEGAEGLAHAVDIARAPCCSGVVFGGVDFAGELGVPLTWEPLLPARAAIVYACARAGVPAFDAPYIYIEDDAGLAAETLRSKALGFAGKVVIHPKQVDTVNAAFCPTAAEIQEARAAVAAYEGSNGGVTQIEGHLVEAPLMRQYRRVLAQAAQQAQSPPAKRSP